MTNNGKMLRETIKNKIDPLIVNCCCCLDMWLNEQLNENRIQITVQFPMQNEIRFDFFFKIFFRGYFQVKSKCQPESECVSNLIQINNSILFSGSTENRLRTNFNLFKQQLENYFSVEQNMKHNQWNTWNVWTMG